MRCFVDDISFGKRIMPDVEQWANCVERDSQIDLVVSEIIGSGQILSGSCTGFDPWNYLLAVAKASQSQYDKLINLARKNIALPDRLLCLAGEGKKFHGFKGRSWASPPGNIYLSVHFTPNKKVFNFAPGFMVLAAVSVVEAIDRVDGLCGKAGIKWVNDILIDGAKVCGVLAHTLTEGEKVTGAILGIGLNVNATPDVEPTPFVPNVTSLADCLSSGQKVAQAKVFGYLIDRLASNYDLLMRDGYSELLERYCERSLILGREVMIRSDQIGDESRVIASGIVEAIGNNLELNLKGISDPVREGRLILDS